MPSSTKFLQKNIITCNGKSNDLTLIDPATDKVVATIPVGGKPETAVSDNKGSLFVNIEDKNEIVVVDLAKRTVTKHFSLAPDEGPTGLAFDVKNNRLFAATDKSLVVVDAVTGKVVKRVAIGEGCDGAAYDAERKMIFTSNGEGTLSIIQQGANDQYTLIENLPTKKSAKTIAIDQQSHAVYLPAAELDHSDPNAKKPAAVPGSFEVLVVSKQ
jgi:YVTN family beta-propeller protein